MHATHLILDASSATLLSATARAFVLLSRIIKSITLEAAPANADTPPSAAFYETASAAWAVAKHFSP